MGWPVSKNHGFSLALTGTNDVIFFILLPSQHIQSLYDRPFLSPSSSMNVRRTDTT